MSNTFHVALYVEDLDAAVAEYQKILGISHDGRHRLLRGQVGGNIAVELEVSKDAV